MIVKRDPKFFCCNFDCPKDVDDNLTHEIEFIIKSNKYKHRNKTYKHKKQQNGLAT